MKIFLDTAMVEEIKELADLIDGVTTNPTLVAQARKPFRKVIEEICRIVDGPVSVEITALDTAGMIHESRELAKIAENVVIKIPMGKEGIRAVKQLELEGIPTNVTLVFSPVQALWAAKAGASYVSPFVGRIDDRAGDGMELISQILQIYENYGFSTEVIVRASGMCVMWWRRRSSVPPSPRSPTPWRRSSSTTPSPPRGSNGSSRTGRRSPAKGAAPACKRRGSPGPRERCPRQALVTRLGPGRRATGPPGPTPSAAGHRSDTRP